MRPARAGLWIDDATGLLGEISWAQWAIVHEHKDGKGEMVRYPNVRSEHVLRIRNVEIDAEIPLDRFRFKPNPGDRRAKRIIYPYSGQGKQSEREDRVAPSFSGRTIKGRKVSVPGGEGHITLLHFWSSQSSEERGQLRSVQRIADRFKDRPVTIIGIHSAEEDGEAGAREILKTMGITFPQVMDGGGTATKKFRLEFFPCSCLLDRHGVVRDILWDTPDDMESEVGAEIEILLKGESLIPSE